MNWEDVLILAGIAAIVIIVVTGNMQASVAAASSPMGNSYTDPVTGATVNCAAGQVVKAWGALNTPGCFLPSAVVPS